MSWETGWVHHHASAAPGIIPQWPGLGKSCPMGNISPKECNSENLERLHYCENLKMVVRDERQGTLCCLVA